MRRPSRDQTGQNASKNFFWQSGRAKVVVTGSRGCGWRGEYAAIVGDAEAGIDGAVVGRIIQSNDDQAQAEHVCGSRDGRIENEIGGGVVEVELYCARETCIVVEDF